MSFDFDPADQASISAADFSIMCDEMKALKSSRDELLDVAKSILADDMLQYLPAEYVAKVRAVIASAEKPADHTVERTEMVADDDGWIEWKGGERPVDGAARVEVKYADGMLGHEIAGSLRWSWIFDGANGGDIIAYRVTKGGAA